MVYMPLSSNLLFIYPVFYVFSNYLNIFDEIVSINASCAVLNLKTFCILSEFNTQLLLGATIISLNSASDIHNLFNFINCVIS